MKYVSEYPYSLKQAHKRIEELESELSILLVENAALRDINRPKRSSPTASSTKPTTPSGTKNYARATVSSRCKDKSIPQKPDGNDNKAPRAVLIAGERYVYKAGVPTLVTTKDSWTKLPRYSASTCASDHRTYAIRVERAQRDKRVERPWPKTSWSVVKEKDFIPPPYSPEPTFSDADTVIGDALEVESLAKMSRLDDRLDLRPDIVYIDVRTGLGYLREAAEITQHAIFEAGSCMPEWKVSQFDDDPTPCVWGETRC